MMVRDLLRLLRIYTLGVAVFGVGVLLLVWLGDIGRKAWHVLSAADRALIYATFGLGYLALSWRALGIWRREEAKGLQGHTPLWVSIIFVSWVAIMPLVGLALLGSLVVWLWTHVAVWIMVLILVGLWLLWCLIVNLFT
jgi:hypothetical protein